MSTRFQTLLRNFKPVTQVAQKPSVCFGILVGRTGFGNIEPHMVADAGLRRLADSDGASAWPSIDAAGRCGLLLATCARENTGVDRVVRALSIAASDWLASLDVKRLRSALLTIIAELD